MRRQRDGVAVQVLDRGRAGADLRPVPVGQRLHQGGVREQRRDIAGQEHLVLADAQHDAARVPQPRRVEAIGPAALHRDDGVAPLDLAQHPAEGLGEARPLAHVQRDQLRDHLAIGLRAALDPRLRQAVTQRAVVLHDAVVHDDGRAVAGDVRVRVAVGDGPVRRPAGVPNAGVAGGRRAEDRFQLGQLAGALEDRQRPVVVEDGHAAAVVAAIVQALQALQQDRPGRLLAHVGDDSAHDRTSSGHPAGRAARSRATAARATSRAPAPPRDGPAPAASPPPPARPAPGTNCARCCGRRCPARNRTSPWR